LERLRFAQTFPNPSNLPQTSIKPFKKIAPLRGAYLQLVAYKQPLGCKKKTLLKKSTNGLVRSLELSSSCACGAINILAKYWSHDSLPVLLRLSRFESSGLQILFRWLGRPQKGPRSETTLLPTLAILVSKQIPTTPTHPDFWEGRQKRKLFTANE
jgi:hypothetical protein